MVEVSVKVPYCVYIHIIKKKSRYYSNVQCSPLFTGSHVLHMDNNKTLSRRQSKHLPAYVGMVRHALCDITEGKLTKLCNSTHANDMYMEQAEEKDCVFFH